MLAINFWSEKDRVVRFRLVISTRIERKKWYSVEKYFKCCYVMVRLTWDDIEIIRNDSLEIILGGPGLEWTNGMFW